MKCRIPVMAFLFAGMGVSFGADLAYAERAVIVNGHELSSAQIERLEQLACVAVPNGNYWIRNDGLWGYAGDPAPRGRIGDYCRRPSLSERGQTYRPGELLEEPDDAEQRQTPGRGHRRYRYAPGGPTAKPITDDPGPYGLLR